METERGNIAMHRNEAKFEENILKENLKPVGKINSLYIYPVKSCRGIEVAAAECTTLGLKCGLLRDRSFVLIDKKGVHIDCLREPRLLRITPSLENFNELCLDAPGKNTLKIYFSELNENKKPPQLCRFSDQDAYGIDCGDWASQWFSSYLNRDNVRLLHYLDSLPPKYCMKDEKFKSLPGQKETDVTVYANFSPYMMASQSSLDDIQRRYNRWLGMRRFRPNIVIEGSPAYEEDAWKYICINEEVWLNIIKSCQRCFIITVDPETGKTDKKGEPLKFMKTFRQTTDPEFRKIAGDQPLMGINLTIESTGKIRTGDSVYAVYKT